MIAQPAQITLRFEHDDLPQAKAVQVTATSQRVTIAYFNMVGIVIKAYELSVQENPELANVAKYSYFGDVWDLEIVESLIALDSPDDRAPELAPLVPAYLQSLSEAS